jgi:hypothetical protein
MLFMYCQTHSLRCKLTPKQIYSPSWTPQSVLTFCTCTHSQPLLLSVHTHSQASLLGIPTPRKNYSQVTLLPGKFIPIQVYWTIIQSDKFISRQVHSHSSLLPEKFTPRRYYSQANSLPFKFTRQSCSRTNLLPFILI